MFRKAPPSDSLIPKYLPTNMAHTHEIYPKQELPSNSPLDVLDFSMSVGANAHKFPNENGQDSVFHQLLNNTAKVSTKYLENNTERTASALDMAFPSLNLAHSGGNKSQVKTPWSNTSNTSRADNANINKEIPPQENHKNELQTNNDAGSGGTNSANKTYECPYCPYKSTRSCNLTNHLQTHYLERPYADPTCTYCATLNNYKIDRMSSNLENQMHPCSHCSLFSPTVQDAVQHLKTHLDDANCICTQRPDAQETDMYDSDHEDESFLKKEDQDKKLYQCTDCDYTARRAQNLKRHAMTHTGERPHSCNQCSYKAPDVSSLRVHMKTHTGERPYQCPHCSYKASQKSTLRNHLKVHTGEKPYSCPHCSYRSSNQTNLNSHVKTHTGEKPYTCPHCSYCATQSSALKCHLRTHTGEKPFTCSQCPYKAAALGNLRSHLKVHANR